MNARVLLSWQPKHVATRPQSIAATRSGVHLAKKVFPRLKMEAFETMCAVKALAVVFRKYMQAGF